MKIRILVSLFLLFIFSACSSPEEPEVYKTILIRIEGIVTDAATNKPIDSALITVFWVNFLKNETGVYFTARTNSEGYYSINEYHYNVGGGAPIKAEALDYQSRSSLPLDSDIPDVRWTEEHQKINFQLEPNNGRIDGKDYVKWDFVWHRVVWADKYSLYVKHAGA